MSIKDWFIKKKPEPELPKVEETPPMPKVKKPKKTPKEIATEKGEPWVNILSMDIDPEDINSGAFELDWNDKFIADLARNGYVGKTDQDMVDQWFQNVCRNIVLEIYEQSQADISQSESLARFHQKKDLGGGRSEIS